jgi:N-acyl-D-aspartate/D-glutamate deacylase
MTDRGLLKPGLAADITVFDPASIAPQSTYLDPIRPAKGVAHVVLNGAVALENGVQTDLRAGRLLRRTYDKKTR